MGLILLGLFDTAGLEVWERLIFVVVRDVYSDCLLSVGLRRCAEGKLFG